MHGFFALGSRLDRRQARRELDVLRWAEKADPLELRARQEARLRVLVRWAYDTVPYYRQAMDGAGVSPGDIQGIDDLPLLPILRRRDIKVNLGSLVSERAGRSHLLPQITGGTMGEPMRLYLDRRALPFERATQWHSLEWAGVMPWAPVLRLTLDGLRPRTLRIKWWNRLTGSALMPLEILYARRPLPVIEMLERVAPAAILGMPSLLHLLAQAVLRSGRPVRARPRCVFYQAEQMEEDTRELLARAFGVSVFSRYGARELSGMVAQTCGDGRWHLIPEGAIVEIVTGDPGDRQGMPARRGRLVITDLRNHVMPFLRYEIGDVGAAAGEVKCPCGRTFPVLGALEGRYWDWAVTAAGLRIPASVLQRQTSRLHGDLLWEYQFRQDRPEVLEVVVVPTGGYGADRQEELARHLEAVLGGGITVRVTPVEHIPREPSGKRPLLKSTLHQGR
jgi:phenylacetate-CoA ligase